MPCLCFLIYFGIIFWAQIQSYFKIGPATPLQASKCHKNTIYQLLLFAIMLVMLPFWAQIKNLRTHCCEPYKLVSSGHKDMILSDLKRYNEGLLKNVKI